MRSFVTFENSMARLALRASSTKWAYGFDLPPNHWTIIEMRLAGYILLSISKLIDWIEVNAIENPI